MTTAPTKNEIVERGMRTLKTGDERPPHSEPETTITRFASRDEILHSGLDAFTNAQLLREWDTAHPGEKPAPPRLLPREREALAEAKMSLEKRQAACVELVGKLERFRQGKDQTAKELKRLEKEADPDKPEDIRALCHLEIRLRIITNRVGDLPDAIRALENSTNAIIEGVNQLLTRKFGASREAGGPIWSNPGFAALPTRITGCCAAIATELSRK